MSTNDIAIEHQPDEQRLGGLGVRDWPIWTKEVSTFPWHYDDSETCYFLEGDVVVTPAGGEPVAMGKGDLVTFPAGMDCTWEVRSPVRKHYRFG
ncbi:MAG: cupin domain-containing protein [Gammaproteobacteria bacterium]